MGFNLPDLSQISWQRFHKMYPSISRSTYFRHKADQDKAKALSQQIKETQQAVALSDKSQEQLIVESIDNSGNLPPLTQQQELVLPTLIRAILAHEGTVQACIKAGIPYSTFTGWKQNSQLFKGIIEQVESQKRDSLVQECENNIRNAGERNWQASAWLLEHIDPKRYGKKDGLHAYGTGTRIKLEFGERNSRVSATVEQVNIQGNSELSTNISDNVCVN